MGRPWVYCKYLFTNKILSDKIHIAWKLLNFCIDSNKQHCNIKNVSRDIGSFLKNPQLKCFEISLIFHGLLLPCMTPKENCNRNLRKSISGVFGKNSWVPIAMLWSCSADSWIYWLEFCIPKKIAMIFVRFTTQIEDNSRLINRGL
jgi:hypothetical protein